MQRLGWTVARQQVQVAKVGHLMLINFEYVHFTEKLSESSRWGLALLPILCVHITL
jgi:hypothetical protein